MVTTGAICQHLVVYLDGDEMKCRECSRSLTHPPRPPDDADKQDRRRDQLAKQGEARRLYTSNDQPEYSVTSCVACRGRVTTQPDTRGVVQCQPCKRVLATVGRRRSYNLSAVRRAPVAGLQVLQDAETAIRL